MNLYNGNGMGNLETHPSCVCVFFFFLANMSQYCEPLIKRRKKWGKEVNYNYDQNKHDIK